MKFKKVEFELNMKNMKGEIYKQKVSGYAIPEVEGLGIHKDKENTNWTRWYVTHITSGHKVHNDHFDTREQSRKYCLILEEITSNGFWTKSEKEVQDLL